MPASSTPPNPPHTNKKPHPEVSHLRQCGCHVRTGCMAPEPTPTRSARRGPPAGRPCPDSGTSVERMGAPIGHRVADGGHQKPDGQEDRWGLLTIGHPSVRWTGRPAPTKRRWADRPAKDVPLQRLVNAEWKREIYACETQNIYVIQYQLVANIGLT